MAPPTAQLLAIAFLLFATGGVRAQGFNYDFQCPDGYAITTLDYRRGANIDTTQGNIRKCTINSTSCQSYNVETQILMKCVFYQPPGCNRACVTLTGEASQCYNALAEVRNNQTLLSLYNITNASNSWGAIGKNVIYVAGLKRTGTTNDTVQRTCCFIRNRVNEGYGGYPQGFFIADMPNNAKRVQKYIPINETWDIRTRYPNASSTALYTNIFLSNWNQPSAIWTEINDLTYNSGNQYKYAHYYSVTAAYTSQSYDLHYCDPCASVTCMNGGTCRKPLETEYGPSFDYKKEVCTCGPNWSGAYCDCSGTVKRDVVFVFGNTNSLSNPANFNATLKVLSDIVDRFNIENGDTRVAAISCGGSASLKFNFTAYTKRSQCKDALTALTYTGGAPNFGQALNLTLSTLQSTGRSDAKKVVIIVSADEPSDSCDFPSQALYATSTMVYSLAITTGLTDSTATKMCGGRAGNIVRVATWTALSTFSATTVTDKIDCQPPPTPSGCDRAFHFGTGVHATFAGGMTTGLAPLNSTVTLSCNGPIFIPIPSLMLNGSCIYDPVTFNFVWKIQSSGPYCKIDPKFGCPRNLSTAIFGPGSVVEYSTGSTVIKKPTNTGTGSSCSLSAVDLAFVVDQSGSIQASNWPKVIKFLKDFTDQLTIGTASTESQVGCVKFNQEGELEFHLNDYTTATTLKDELDLSYDGGYTNIEDGLFVAINEVFDSAEGDRPDVPNVIILLTDGKDDSDCESMYNLAQSKNIDILAIGIGDGVDKEQLKKCVGGDESKIFTVDNFDGLDELTTSICTNITKSSNATEVAPVGTNITITCQGPAYVKNDNADDGFYTCEFIDPDRFEWSGLDPEDPADEPFCKLVETQGCPRNITAILFGDGAKITYSDGKTDPTVLVELGGTVKITCDGPAYTVDREGPSAILRCLVDNGEYYWLGLDSHYDFSEAFCKLDETLGCPSNITSLFGDHVDFHFNVPGGIIKHFLALNTTVDISCMGPAYYGGSFTITCEIVDGDYEWKDIDEAINGVDCKLNTTFGCPSDIKNWFDEDVVSIHFDFDGIIGDFFDEGVIGEIGCLGPVYFGASFQITCKVIEGHYEWEGLDIAKNITCERNITFGCPSDIKSWFDIDIVSIHFDFDGEIGDFFDEGVTAEIGCLGPVYFGASLTITCKVIEGHYEWEGLDEAKNITCERNTTFGCPSDIKNWFDMDGAFIHFDFDGEIGDFFDEGVTAEIGCMGPLYFGASFTITCKVIEGHYEWFGLDEAKNITCERNNTSGCPSDIKNWFDMDGAFIHFDFDGEIGDFFDEGVTAEIGCMGPVFFGASFTITCKVIEGHFEWFGLDEAKNITCERNTTFGCPSDIKNWFDMDGAFIHFDFDGEIGDFFDEGVTAEIGCMGPVFFGASFTITCKVIEGHFEWFGLDEAKNITCERNTTFGCPSDIKNWFDMDGAFIHFDFDGEIGDFFDEGISAEIGCMGPVFFGASFTITCKVIEGHFEWFGLDEAKNITCERNTTFGCPSDIKNWFDMDGAFIHFDFDGEIGDFFDEGISAEIGCMGPVFFGASFTITCKVIEGHFEWFGLDEAKNITCERNTTFGCPSDIKNWFDMDGAFIHFDFDGEIGDFFDEGISAEIGCMGPVFFGASFTITCKVIEGHFEWFGLDEAKNITCERNTTFGCPSDIKNWFDMDGAFIHFDFDGEIGDFFDEGISAEIGCMGPVYFGASFTITCKVIEGHFEWFGLDEAKNITCERNTTFGCPSDIKNWFDEDGAFIHFDFDGEIGDFFDEGVSAEIGCLGPAYIGAHFTITCKVIDGHYEWFGLDEAVNGTHCELDENVGCSRNISEEIFGAGAVVKFSDNGVGDVCDEGVDMIVSCDGPKFIPVNGTASVSFTCTMDGKGGYVWFGLAEAEADFPFCECACYCPAL